MYKLLIVDDEDVEREGMAEFIRWEDYGVRLVGTAWNGVEGYEEIQNQMPDIVITDIKMPVMNGIELIRKTKEDFPDIIFIVLSGYGEYEYTSLAMELGVRHYILKPCDENRVVEALSKAKDELKGREDKRQRENAIRSQVKRLAPRAREQMFRNVLLKREELHKDFESYLEERGMLRTSVFLTAFHKENRFDYLEQFVLTNILTELLGNQHVVLVTSIRNDVIFLLDQAVFKEMEPVLVKVKKEYEKFDSKPVFTAVSLIGSWENVEVMYEEIVNTIRMNHRGSSQSCIDEEAIKGAESYDQILFELYLGLVKIRLSGELGNQKEIFLDDLSYLYGNEEMDIQIEEEDTEAQLLIKGAEYICKRQKIKGPGEKEEGRMRQILQGIYVNIGNPELSIQWLTKEVLYMNEDYFGRIFSKSMKQKYSSYVLNTRIELAKRLIRDFPDSKLSQIAEEVGYPADGQYFSKTFRKLAGKSPSSYKEYIQSLK